MKALTCSRSVRGKSSGTSDLVWMHELSERHQSFISAFFLVPESIKAFHRIHHSPLPAQYSPRLFNSLIGNFDPNEIDHFIGPFPDGPPCQKFAVASTMYFVPVQYRGIINRGWHWILKPRGTCGVTFQDLVAEENWIRESVGYYIRYHIPLVFPPPHGATCEGRRCCCCCRCCRGKNKERKAKMPKVSILFCLVDLSGIFFIQTMEKNYFVLRISSFKTRIFRTKPSLDAIYLQIMFVFN